MNTLELLDTTRRSGQLATNDPVYTNAAILSELTQAQIDKFAEPVSSLRQGYGLHSIIYSTSATLNYVRLPHRSVAQGAEKVELSSDSGQSYYALNIMTQPQADAFGLNSTGASTHFTLEGDTIRLYPSPGSTNYFLRVYYYVRGPELIEYSASGIVTDVTATTITVNTDPSLLDISVTSGFDCQNVNGSFELSIVGGTITSITGAGPYVINVPSTLDTSRVQVGDYVRPPDKAVFPALPIELHRPLCDYTAGMIWLSKGDKEKAASLSSKAQSGIDRLVTMAAPRIKARPFVWKARNSYLRSRLG